MLLLAVGELVYLKPVLTGDEPLDVQRFAANHSKKGKAFPHQPTSDQFFDESQFESYRMLGLHAAQKHFSSDWDGWLGKAAPAQAAQPQPAPIKVQEAPSVEETWRALQALVDQLKPGKRPAA